ncbi:hypothetical protein [Pandoraea commovens]|uniref:Uncharacterized protein n=1 Tax=Pandoraea commovens TaxID=2508289 RepID=A0ABY5QIY5_9BURK|nr:hypothetical protein [Pandoraea commovens]UVA80762.1 hypothetical protein NTU39_07100 [Pandoraea commovens]
MTGMAVSMTKRSTLPTMCSSRPRTDCVDSATGLSGWRVHVPVADHSKSTSMLGGGDRYRVSEGGKSGRVTWQIDEA